MPGGMRRLDGLDEFGMIAGFTPKGVDFYKELQPTCRTDLISRIYVSKYTDKAERATIKASKAKITSGATQLPEPWFILMAKCQQQPISFKSIGIDTQLKKEDLGLMVILVDFIVILFFIYFVYLLNKKQDEYIEFF